MTQKKKLNLPKLIGHRGVKNLCPENTLNSINEAFDLGLNFVEVDVKISKDNIPILLHDDTLNRTTNGNGYVKDYEYNHIKKLDAGEHFYNKKTEIFVPKLIDVLKLCKKRKSNLNIELKPNIGCEKINASKIYDLTKNIDGMEIFYSSFDLDSFFEISKLLPYSNRSFLLDTFDHFSLDDLLNIIQEQSANICGLNINIISNEIINKIKKYNLIITVYSDENINTSDAKDLFDIGVDSIFIDDPRQLIIDLNFH